MTKINYSPQIKTNLNGFGPVYWINLDSDTERKNRIEALFSQYEIPNIRISGLDGRAQDLSSYLDGDLPSNMSSSEVGYTLSHLKALRYFLTETSDDFAIICEDDIIFDTVEYWPFNWQTFLSSVPYDWDCLQLAVTNTGIVIANLHPRVLTDFCTVCNVFTRRYAQKLADLHFVGEKYKIDNGVKPKAVADELLFNAGKTYSMPLFIYHNDTPSNVNGAHFNVHKFSADRILSYWQEYGNQITAGFHLTYDYYKYYNELMRILNEVDQSLKNKSNS